MAAYEVFVNFILRQHETVIQSLRSYEETVQREFQSRCDSVEADIQEYNRTGMLKFNSAAAVTNDDCNSEENMLPNVVIKNEKLSDVINELIPLVVPKEEPVEMPPPVQPPLRRMHPRSKKYVPALITLNETSDVKMYPEQLETVIIDESDEEIVEKPKRKRTTKRKLVENELENVTIASARATRSTARNLGKVVKLGENQAVIGNQQESPKSDEIDRQEANIRVLNETVVLPSRILNATVIIQKPTYPEMSTNIPSIPSNVSDLMTDDEDPLFNPIPKEKPVKTPILKILGPSSNNAVKKRVEAFEKLGVELPAKRTRTKTKAKETMEDAVINEVEKQKAPEASSKYVNESLKPKSVIPKYVGTPVLGSKKWLNGSQKQTNAAGSTSASKPNNILAPCYAEVREREMRRKQKEAEALAKKEAMIQQQMEEKRQIREQRQLKAQQARDALEKDKQKLLEAAERQKNEKMRQIMAEKEEKLAKQKEEAANKRALVLKKQKAILEKQKERCRKDNIRTPPYLKYQTPPLPTDDCYDSDDEESSKKRRLPSWENRSYLSKNLKRIEVCGPLKKRFFSNEPRTVDLQEIFPAIEPHKLKRTSSARWNRSAHTNLASMILKDDESFND